jgi:hypothetical protein
MTNTITASITIKVFYIEYHVSQVSGFVVANMAEACDVGGGCDELS